MLQPPAVQFVPPSADHKASEHPELLQCDRHSPTSQPVKVHNYPMYTTAITDSKISELSYVCTMQY